MAPAGPQVDEIAFRRGQQIPQRQNVGLGQVGNVYVVPDGRPVRSREVRPIEVKDLLCPEQEQEEVGDEVGFRVMHLTQVGIRVCPRGVEVAKGDGLQPVGFIVILEDPLHE